MRRHPHLYELNARIFLSRLSEKYHKRVTLATVPDTEWQLLSQRGFDLVWLMGVWQRSQGAREEALRNEALRREYDQALPGWTEADVAGSPYAVYGYTLDTALGEPDELAQLQSQLNRLGLGLILDFVPNHLALDHPWVLSHPRWFVQGRAADVRAHPDWFFASGSRRCLAHGRDPNFAPWTDTVQVNFYSTELRQALINELSQIAEVADGVRCDMAMLALNQVFEEVWGGVLRDYPQLETEFWTEAIGQVKKQRPGFLFLAEVYWEFEPKLQQLGFDFTYDKLLYDRLRFCPPADIYCHLMSDTTYQEHSAHFIENHDELRAITVFGRQRSLAAATVIATVPDLRLFHDGQLEGRRVRLPVQLVRAPEETVDAEILRFYERLLTICNASAFHEGEWRLLETCPAWECNDSHCNLLAYLWRSRREAKIVVVNYSPVASQGRLKLPLPLGTSGNVAFVDELTGATYLRDPQELANLGLYIALEPWQAHILHTDLA